MDRNGCSSRREPTNRTPQKDERTPEEVLRQVLDTAHDAFVAINARGAIVSWNRQAESVFGWSQKEILGKPLSECIIPPQYRQKHLEGFQHFLKTGEGLLLNQRIELSALRRDGTEFPVELTIGSPVSHGKDFFIPAFVRDITERKRAEAALAKAKEIAEAANRELESFSYSVAHDLRAPLRGIDGFSQILLEDYAEKLDAEGKGYLNQLRTFSKYMAQLIESLLMLAHLSRSEVHNDLVDLTELARATTSRLQRAQPERWSEFLLTEGLVARGDGRLLGVLLENLLGNAWKFTGKQKKARIEFGATVQNGRPVYFVRDNGAGFDMAYAQKLFGVFQRLHRQDEFEGVGIGLATTQRIVHRHGGRIWAEGKVNEGATFYFTIGDKEQGI